MSIPSHAEMLQLAYTRLNTYAPLIAIVGQGVVFNHIPQEHPLPVLRVRWQDCNAWDTKDSQGWEGSIVVDAWTSERGDKKALQIADAVNACYHEQELMLSNGQNLLLRHDSMYAFTEPDGITHHTTMRFTAIITE